MYVTQLITFRDGCLIPTGSAVFKHEHLAHSTARHICGPGHKETAEGNAVIFRNTNVMCAVFTSRFRGGSKR